MSVENLENARARPALRRAIVLVSVNIVLVGLAAALYGGFLWLRASSTSQNAAGAWSNGDGERYAQVSVFFDIDHGLDELAVFTAAEQIGKLLRENSIEPPEGAKPFNSAYSGTANVSVTSSKGSSEAIATGVGGDFFFFHFFQLVSGSFISGDDLLKDVVVIDDVLAWRLYGASNVVGFEIEVNGKKCYVGGVVRRGDKWPDSKSYGEASRIFLPYETLAAITPELRISTLEVVLPDPVSGFGAGIVEKAVNVPEGHRHLVENSARYGELSLLRSAFSAGEQAMQTKAIAFPYWENAARYAGTVFGQMLVAALALLVFPAMCAVLALRKLWRARIPVYHALRDRHRKRHLERWQKKTEKKLKKEKIKTAKDEVQV